MQNLNKPIGLKSDICVQGDICVKCTYTCPNCGTENEFILKPGEIASKHSCWNCGNEVHFDD